MTIPFRYIESTKFGGNYVLQVEWPFRSGAWQDVPLVKGQSCQHKHKIYIQTLLPGGAISAEKNYKMSFKQAKYCPECGEKI